MNTDRIQRAVVFGCGFAGIAAAAALSGKCSEVVLIEQDRLPTEPKARRGLPQAEQLHNLLGRAQVEIERLLPGFIDELRKAGCGDASVANETHVYEAGHRSPERNLGLRMICAWRPIIDHVALQLLGLKSEIKIRDGMRAIGIEITPKGEIAGAVLRTPDGLIEKVDAEIVVDATGAGSRAFQWLTDHSDFLPIVDSVRHDQWYVTCLCERPSSWVGDNAFWLTFPSPPHTRSGLVSPVTPTQWYVSLSGRKRDEPPRTFEAMKAFAETLEDPAIGALLENAVASGTPHLFQRKVATWRRYDLLPRPLTGFLPIGDALGVLNPLMGQGISVAAWQASGLADLLKYVPFAELTAAYLHHAAMACGRSWRLQELIDRAVGGPNSDNTRSKLLSRLIVDDANLHSLYVRIWHLLEAPERLGEILDRVAAESE